MNIDNLGYLVAAFVICWGSLGLYLASLFLRGDDGGRSG